MTNSSFTYNNVLVGCLGFNGTFNIDTIMCTCQVLTDILTVKTCQKFIRNARNFFQNYFTIK